MAKKRNLVKRKLTGRNSLSNEIKSTSFKLQISLLLFFDKRKRQFSAIGLYFKISLNTALRYLQSVMWRLKSLEQNLSFLTYLTKWTNFILDLYDKCAKKRTFPGIRFWDITCTSFQLCKSAVYGVISTFKPLYLYMYMYISIGFHLTQGVSPSF